MKFPIIISAKGDLYFYLTLDYAQTDIEPIDVRNGEYTIYDAEGRLLLPRIDLDRGIEFVQIKSSSESRPDELKNLLIGFFSEVGHDENTLGDMNLSKLVEIGRAYVKDKTEPGLLL